MLNRFRSALIVDGAEHLDDFWDEPLLLRSEGYREIASEFAGRSFNGGLYRLHDASSGPIGQQQIVDVFPRYAARARPFAYDWLGRQFALDDARRTNDGQALVLLFEPGSGQVLEVPATFVQFHDSELVDFADAALASSFYAQWSALNAAFIPLGRDECAGYKVPLFLGGEDVVENLEVVDLEVYWTLCGQLRSGTLRMSEGVTIKQIVRQLEP